ncbi:MAG: hypothetical protein KC766_04155 [Myxococcales bacterium]|nr:hypothetical protein [Myxococcales bacterium]
MIAFASEGMGTIGLLLSHELLSLLVLVLSVVLVGSVLHQRRPTGSAFAWVLGIVLLPYVAIPLFLMFGGRKFRQRWSSKRQLSHRSYRLLPRGKGSDESGPSPVVWLDSGEAAYAEFSRQIRRAQHSIRILTFVIGDDISGRALVQALTERARAGVDVRLLVDDLLFFRVPKRELRALEAAGGHVARFMPLWHWPFRGQANLRNHRKIALFDGDVGIVGGMNLADEYMGEVSRVDRWRDLSLVVSGATVAELDEIFRADWEFAAHEKLPSAAPGTQPVEGSGVLDVLPSGPDLQGDPIYEAFLELFFRARQRIWIATPYFAPDDALLKALEIAVRRGVDVRVVVPQRSNHPLADRIAGPYLRQLDHQGVAVWRFGHPEGGSGARVAPRMLHAKAVLIDDEVAVVGSANLDMRSLLWNYEVALFMRSAREAEHLACWFHETFSESAQGAPNPSWLVRRFEDGVRLLAPLA